MAEVHCPRHLSTPLPSSTYVQSSFDEGVQNLSLIDVDVELISRNPALIDPIAKANFTRNEEVKITWHFGFDRELGVSTFSTAEGP